MKTERTPEQHERDRWEHARVAALQSVFYFARLMNEEPCYVYAREMRGYANTVASLSYRLEGLSP